ncbi:MAG: DsbA family protein [Bdellovibrionales bacterium]|nr:DsbA family protein [Bdellovibrionales bacterium]
MNNKTTWIIVAALAVLAGFYYAASTFYKTQEAAKVATEVKENSSTLVPDYAIRKGSPDAKVTIVEFFDPECESCREFNPYMHAIMNDYAGKVQLVMRYAAFHGNSIFAIKILEAARKQDKYWEALEIMFQHQPEWGNHHHPRPELVWNYLPRLGIDVDKIKADMEDPAIQKIIEQDTKDGQALSVRGTPTFFVNGKQLEQFGPDFLRAAIDEALKEN